MKGPPKTLPGRHRQGAPPTSVGEERPGARRTAGRRPEAVDRRRRARACRRSPSSCSAWRPRASTWSTTRWTSRPTGRTRPSGSVRSPRACVPVNLAYALAVVLLIGSIAGVVPGELASGRGDGGLHRHPAGLLLRPQAPGRARHLHRVLRLPAARGRRWRRPRVSPCRSGSC